MSDRVAPAIRRVLTGALVAALSLAACLLMPHAAHGQTPLPSPSPDDCALIGVQEAGQIVGLAVSGPDDVTERQGRCLFPSRQMSADGSVMYAFVRSAQIPQLQAYYKVMMRTCAGVAPGAPRETLCKTIERLADAGDIDAYYAARSDVAESRPVPELGDKAVATSNGVFVRRDDYVLEAIVSKNQEVVILPSIALAQLLLKRLEPKLH